MAEQVKTLGNLPDYYSLYDSVDFSLWNEQNAYNGTLRNVLEDLQKDTYKDFFPPKLQRILHPPRIVRAVIDQKVRDDDVPGAVPFVQSSLRPGFAIYHHLPKENILQQIQDLEEHLQSKGNELLLDWPLYQKEDVDTWRASCSKKSRVSARMLATRLQGDNVLFLSLAHGSVGVGMDVFLRYRTKSKTSDSDFYPVRFSTRKNEDTYPQINDEEEEYIREQAKTRAVVIFDEDMSSGHTMEKAEVFFCDILSPTTHILGLVNADYDGKRNGHPAVVFEHKAVRPLYTYYK